METKDKLRVRVAELCPDLFEVHQTWRGPEGGGYRTFLIRKGEDISGDEVDPLTDLNACAEFEKWLRGTELQFYYELDYHERYHRYLALLNDLTYGGKVATAEQRCRAFIATMEGTK